MASMLAETAELASSLAWQHFRGQRRRSLVPGGQWRAPLLRHGCGRTAGTGRLCCRGRRGWGLWLPAQPSYGGCLWSVTLRAREELWEPCSSSA